MNRYISSSKMYIFIDNICLNNDKLRFLCSYKGAVSTSLRFGEVFKVPTLEVSFQQVSEEVRTKVLKAERKVGKKRVLVASLTCLPRECLFKLKWFYA